MKKSDETDAGIDAFLEAHARIASAASLAPGTVVGTWRLTAFLGRGGCAEVYRGEHVSLPLQAAVKVLTREGAAQRARFDRETQLLYENTNPAFPRYLGAGEYEGRPFVAMELLEPIELPSSDAAVADYILAVAAGVLDLHAKGYVHRDLKPSNVMRRKGGSPVIIDFGRVKEVAGGGADAASAPPPAGQTLSFEDGRPVGVGTPRYAAPEQFNGGEVSRSSDVHALGMLLNECFGGRPPRCWAKVIRRATSSIPEQRYRDVAAFMRAVRARHRVTKILWTTVLLLASCVVAAAGWLWMRNRPTPDAQKEQREAKQDAFPIELKLNGQTRVFDRPIILQNGEVYTIRGPGTLDADISCPTGTANLHLIKCVILNRTNTLYPENGIKYWIENGAYLNFINMPARPKNLPASEFIHLTKNPKSGEVRFGGPPDREGLMGLHNIEYYNPEYKQETRLE